MTRRAGRLAPALILALCQVSLLAQSTARQSGATTSWADEILKKETYATPPQYVKNPQKAEPAKKITTDSASR